MKNNWLLRIYNGIRRRIIEFRAGSIESLGFPVVEPEVELNRVLNELVSHKQQNVFFLQIGANDGNRYDPISEFIHTHSEMVSGVVVEPVPEYFYDLSENYRTIPSIIPINAAIHNSKSRMDIHVVDTKKAEDHELDEWVKGIASFNVSHHSLSGVPKSVMKKISVPCLSLESLILARKISHIDLLLIDTEGYDAEILMGIDFGLIKPTIIFFEHGISSGIMSRKVFLKVANKLTSYGYKVSIGECDAIALKGEDA